MKGLNIFDSLRLALPEATEAMGRQFLMDGRFGPAPAQAARPQWSLLEEGLEAKLLIPGVSPADVHVSAQGRSLSVEVKNDTARGSWSWNLSREFDLSKIVARVSRGVLTLSIPRVPADPVVPIEVIDVDSLVHQAIDQGEQVGASDHSEPDTAQD